MDQPAKTPVAICQLCNGPIYFGEPALTVAGGLAHRFSTSCQHYRDEEARFVRDVGIKLGADGSPTSGSAAL